jgi:hypothetical protein
MAMNDEEWESEVHERVRQEPIWQFVGYRKALFFYDLVWQDCEKLMQDARGRAVAEQVIRSAGSIGANLEEGHGRGYGKQRNGRGRRLLSPEVLNHRLALADEIIALLITELNYQRSR